MSLFVPSKPSIEIDSSRFRNNSNTRYLKGLFYEMVLKDKSSVVYTLKDVDHEGYPSLYRLYMETADPTEWKFAQWYLDGWDHWDSLTHCSWFLPFIERWRVELELMYRSSALVNIVDDAISGSKTSYQSNKLLLDGGWKPKDTVKERAGRPSSKAVEKKAKMILEERTDINEDWERLFN